MTRALIRRWLPNARLVRGSRALRWLGPLLERPWLWRASRGGIALGIAIGLFFGLLLPFAQSLFAGALSVLLRANLPAAVLATFVSNPLTTPGIVVGAYYVGAATLGVPFVPVLPDADWIERLAAMGEPLLLGLFLVASIASLAGYCAVHLAWRFASLSRLARRRQTRGGTQ